MRFTVEAWAPEYGASIESAELEAADQEIDTSVEVPSGRWEPRTPPPGTSPPSVVSFVDGVRRTEARVWIDDGAISRPGVCASVAAGIVRCDGRAEVVRHEVFRLLAAHPAGAEDLVTRPGCDRDTYHLIPVPDPTPEAVNLAIHDQMSHLERELSEEITAGELVVFDGPLRGRRTIGGVGYIKTQQRQYLGDAEQAVVARLDDGQRSPLFLIGGGYSRYSWYLRLPGPHSHPFAGIVRCEVGALGSVGDAIAEADRVSATLPRFASAPHKDARAPQNLYPIAGLEHRLRHLLGDAQLLERALRRASYA